MTKYEPKTSHSYRNGQRLDSLEDARDVIANLRIDLTHAEACLKEAYAEIERLKAIAVQPMIQAPPFVFQEYDHANS